MVEKVKKTRRNPAQQSARSRVLPSTISGPEILPNHRGEIYTPRKKPDQVQSPEGHTGNGVVIARIAKIQKTQDVFIHEIKPEKAAIFTGTAVHGEIKIGRHAQGS